MEPPLFKNPTKLVIDMVISYHIYCICGSICLHKTERGVYVSYEIMHAINIQASVSDVIFNICLMASVNWKGSVFKALLRNKQNRTLTFVTGALQAYHKIIPNTYTVHKASKKYSVYSYRQLSI